MHVEIDEGVAKKMVRPERSSPTPRKCAWRVVSMPKSGVTTRMQVTAVAMGSNFVVKLRNDSICRELAGQRQNKGWKRGRRERADRQGT